MSVSVLRILVWKAELGGERSKEFELSRFSFLILLLQNALLPITEA